MMICIYCKKKVMILRDLNKKNKIFQLKLRKEGGFKKRVDISRI